MNTVRRATTSDIPRILELLVQVDNGTSAPAEAATPFYEQYAERISDYLQTLRKMNI